MSSGARDVDGAAVKLSDLTPADVAAEAHDRVVGQAQRLAFAAGYDLVPGGAHTSDVRHAVEALTHYAQTGQYPEGRPELIGEYLQSLAEPLYTRATDGAGYDVPELDHDADPETPWGLVLVAAVARDQIARRRGVTLAGLAVLAEVSPSRMRQLVSVGELETDGGKPARVPAGAARRWLEARGVAGVRRPTK